MTVDIRLVCDPEEAKEAEEALRSAFDFSRIRRYPSHRSNDSLLYIYGAKPKGAGSPAVIDHDRIEGLKYKLVPIEGKNHVFMAVSFPAPDYVNIGIAKCLNDAFQDDIRRIIDSKIKDVYIRMDQSYKPPKSGYALYHSGDYWLDVPYYDDATGPMEGYDD